MISQMNVVQNAARLAMDHRAARPRKSHPRPAGYLSLFVRALFVIGIVAIMLALTHYFLN